MQVKCPPGATVPDADNPWRQTFAPRPATSEVLPVDSAPATRLLRAAGLRRAESDKPDVTVHATPVPAAVATASLEPAKPITGRKVAHPAPDDGA